MLMYLGAIPIDEVSAKPAAPVFNKPRREIASELACWPCHSSH